MIKEELLIKRHSDEIVVGLSLDGMIRFWSEGMAKLMGYDASEAMDKHVSEFLPAEYKGKFKSLIELLKEEGSLLNRSIEGVDKEGNKINLAVSLFPLLFEGKMEGMYALVRKRGTTRHLNDILDDEKHAKRVKRTFSQIRLMILGCLLNGSQSTNQIANCSGINWRTVEKHLIYLVGKRFVNEVFKSEYIRIFEISDDGRNYLDRLSSKQKEVREVITR